MNAHDAPTMKATKKNATKAVPSVDRPSSLAPAAAAFEALKGEYAELPETSLVSINVDIPRAVAVILGAEPRVQALRPAIEAALKNPPTRAIEGLRQAALGAWYAHLITMPAKPSASAKELLERATPLRAKLLKAADALADAELVDATTVARIREGRGNIDMANDLVALSALFSQRWGVIQNKTAIAREQVDEAALLGPTLLVALAEQPLPASNDASALRQRAFSLLVSLYDEIRRAVSFVRWAEKDVEAYAPSLYAKSRRKRLGEAGKASEADVGEDDVDAPEEG